jgi:hypothetical protein
VSFQSCHGEEEVDEMEREKGGGVPAEEEGGGGEGASRKATQLHLPVLVS